LQKISDDPSAGFILKNSFRPIMKKIIHTSKSPQAIGPYSQAVAINNFLYVSGQVPVNPENGEVVAGGTAEQAHQVMKNLEAILEEAGVNFSNVVKATIFVQDLNDFTVVNEIYASYFTDKNYPARECVEVARLPRDVRVEISMIAYL